ncbi:hypothetical protein [Nocardia sp. NPDC051463]|uniref:hypothetical protein n=1 Tax=Nocardia sp. NPDC051463 TaxID=3154845 RepID=UPI00344BB9AC
MRTPDSPGVVRVDAGATLENERSIPVPFEVEHPYTSVAALFLTPRPPRPYSIVFCVGAVPSEVADPQPDTTRMFNPRDFRLAEQTTFCSPQHTI